MTNQPAPNSNPSDSLRAASNSETAHRRPADTHAKAAPDGPTPLQKLQSELTIVQKQNEILTAQLAQIQTQKSIIQEALPAGQAKGQAGEVTADESKRFLAEVAANHGLARAARTIAADITARAPGVVGPEPGAVAQRGILIVDELAYALNDLVLIDIREKLAMLTRLVDDQASRCAQFAPAQEESGTDLKEKAGETPAAVGARLESLSALAPVVGAGLLSRATAGVALAGSVVPAITGALSVLGDIASFFRSDVAIKGQTLTNIDDDYIKTLVAGQLIESERSVFLLNFNAVKNSTLLTALSNLTTKRHTLLTCTQRLSSKCVEGKAARLQALETHLASLRAKLIEYVVKVDSSAVQALRGEITALTQQLASLEAQRTPDAQITALEKYLADLRTQLVEKAPASTNVGRDALETEIRRLAGKIAANPAPGSPGHLSPAEITALGEIQKELRSRYATAVLEIGQDPKRLLQGEIQAAEDKLQRYQAARVPDAQITALQTLLTSLHTKLVDRLNSTDADARANLETEIRRTLRLIRYEQQDLTEARGLVNGGSQVIAALDAFFTSITTVPAGGQAPLTQALIREYVNGNEDIGYLLKLRLVSSGADFITKKPNILTWNPTTSYLGGGVVSYVLAQRDGHIAAAGTVSDIAGLDHRIGKAPETLRWTIHPEALC